MPSSHSANDYTHVRIEHLEKKVLKLEGILSSVLEYIEKRDGKLPEGIHKNVTPGIDIKKIDPKIDDGKTTAWRQNIDEKETNGK